MEDTISLERSYSARSAVLLIVFNRPDTTLQVFNAIRSAKPSRLYISADGPRPWRPGEAALCMETRAIVSRIDWKCEVKTLFSETNSGCKLAVSKAISWFFNQEEEGIILEDDCLPAESFFQYCDCMLEQYRTDTRIHIISGSNLFPSITTNGPSYSFTRFTGIWGWASWSRVWKKYDVNLELYPRAEAEKRLTDIFDDKYISAQWLQIYKEVKNQKVDTWDYQLCLMNLFENAINIFPAINLISNIGFRPDATHTPDPKSKNANLPTGIWKNELHPSFVLPDKEQDNKLQLQEFRLDRWWSKPKLQVGSLKRHLIKYLLKHDNK